MKPRVILYGAGGHGKVVADIVEKQGLHVIAGFLDDGRSGEVFGVPVLGGEGELARIRESGVRHAVPCIGDRLTVCSGPRCSWMFRPVPR